MISITSIGIDISKKKCDYVLDLSVEVVERGQYHNTMQDVRQTAPEMARRYGAKKGKMQGKG